MARWEDTDLAQVPPPPIFIEIWFSTKKGKKNIVVCLVHVIYRHLVERHTYNTS